MSRVFLIHEPRARKDNGWLPDLSTAEEYGRLAVIFSKDNHPSYMHTADIHNLLDLALRDFNPATDFIVWCGGDIAAIVHVSAYLAQHHKSVQMLRWDNRRNEQKQRVGGFYRPATITFSQ